MPAFTIDSKFTDYTYQIDVYIPETAVPEGGFPVYYILDGTSYFPFARNTIELQYRNAAKTFVGPAVIVGIGHPKETMRTRRFYDFTAPAAAYHYPDRMQKRIPPAVGGAEDFIQFIETEVKPIIHSDYPVNPHDEILFGHSLSGYYTLWTLFTRPESFAGYIAISPSLWWNDYELNRYMEFFLKNSPAGKRLFLAAGEKEGFMGTDAQDLHENLKKHNVTSGFYLAPDENHASVVPTVISRAFRYMNQSI